MTRRVTILGSTGSVGVSTLELLADARASGAADFEIVALTAGRNVELLAEQALRWRPEKAVIADEGGLAELRDRLAGSGVRAQAGTAAVVEAADSGAEWVMSAIVGVAGLQPTLAAARSGAVVALANKESLVCAGAALTDAARNAGAVLVPVDSEHSAIFQVLQPGQADKLDRLILTASGGPFRSWERARMAAATPEQAVAHPNWSMGAKISVDSATMMNKGLELIEASYLFDVPETQVEILVHPQSIVHSLVQYRDGSTLAQLGAPDMRTPIACAFAWPDRMCWDAPRLDLAQVGTLTFEAPDSGRFPALELARAALRAGGLAPAVLNAANETAVQAFLDRRIGFLDIADTVGDVLERMSGTGSLREAGSDPLAAALQIDAEARAAADDVVRRRERTRRVSV